MKIHLIVAARPNFMKIAPLYRALCAERWCDPVIVHTGQHYDRNMAGVFFDDFNLGAPSISLGVGSGTHAEQTGNVMIAYEKEYLKDRPDLTVVVGDVNSTVACALAVVKQGGIVAHLEAGLRSFDRTMPEEVNRIVTDSIADILWTPSPDADENLKNEGISFQRIVRVGNIMIDSFESQREAIKRSPIMDKLGLAKETFILSTLHRPSNVDVPEKLLSIYDALVNLSERVPVVIPLHPRTRVNLSKFAMLAKLESLPNVILTEPLGYHDFMNLVSHCRMMVTDSGGVQEETSYLGVPCLTVRENTERPITITHGTNVLCAPTSLLSEAHAVLDGPSRYPTSIALWDGQTSARVVHSIRHNFGGGAA